MIRATPFVAFMALLISQSALASSGSAEKCGRSTTDFYSRIKALAQIGESDHRLGSQLRSQAADFLYDFSFEFPATPQIAPTKRIDRAKQVIGRWVKRNKSALEPQPDVDFNVRLLVPASTSVPRESRLERVFRGFEYENDYGYSNWREKVPIYKMVDTSETSVKSNSKSDGMRLDENYLYYTGTRRYSDAPKPISPVEEYFWDKFARPDYGPSEMLAIRASSKLVYVNGALLRLGRISRDGAVWELTGPLGEIGYVTVTRKNDMLTLTPVKSEAEISELLSSHQWLSRRNYPRVSEPSRNFEVSTFDSMTLAREMLLSQARTSETVREGVGTEWLARENLLRVNYDIVESVKNREAPDRGMTREKLIQLNKSLRAVVTSFEHGAGVIRGGTKANMIKIKGEEHDASRIELVSKGREFSYVPAREVEARLNDWISKVDAILTSRHGGSFAEIVSLYREFLIIHPFLDGNGRTSRVVLDWMLISSGYAPVPHIRGLTDEVFFKTAVEEVEDILLAYYISERNRTVVFEN